MIKSPCEECICVPICRHKGYLDLVNDCDILLKLLYRGDHYVISNRSHIFNKVIFNIERCLRPSKWKIDIELGGFIAISDRS